MKAGVRLASGEIERFQADGHAVRLAGSLVVAIHQDTASNLAVFNSDPSRFYGIRPSYK